ncbi:uncharacterized protein LOC114739246 [Neltuma alba]|uniref:uncharacterized protein LOC114739246 n=1 Tax=Neltuma alba TaxID=207710 RepID=UPI0010A34F77|nr:uncharacterized protein LOC114739246 [Prosopis alba]
MKMLSTLILLKLKVTGGRNSQIHYTPSDAKSNGSSPQSDDKLEEEDLQFTTGIRPKKRLRWAKVDGEGAIETGCLNDSGNETKRKVGNNSLRPVGSTASKEAKENALQYLAVGSQEWVSASRIAARDHLDLRLNGRTTIRPAPQSSLCKFSGVVNVGSIVDVWRHDGWWEGIVVQKESEATCHVYFPGEKFVLILGSGELRRAQEWTGSGWVRVRERPDLVSSILSSLKTSQDPSKSAAAACAGDAVLSKQRVNNTSLNPESDKSRKPELIPDLSKDDLLSQLRWKSSRKRGRSSSSGSGRNNCRKSPDSSDPHASDSYMIAASLKVVDHDDCKYGRGDQAIFSSSVVPSLTNLVMCR